MPDPQPRPERIDNPMAWAILTTLFCCLPLGIVSIVYAVQVDGKRAAGDIEGARTAAEKARFWAIWAVLGGLAQIVVCLAILLLAVSMPDS